MIGLIQKKELLTRVEVSRSALHWNIARFRNLCNGSMFLAVVKANAYGHGLAEVVRSIRDAVDWWGVNTFEEAVRIREIESEIPILVMGRMEETDYPRLVELEELNGVLRENPSRAGGGNGYFKGRIIPVLSTSEDLRVIKERASQITFHLKVDTGMGRLGTRGDKTGEVLQFLRESPQLAWSGLMTHFANVEDVTDQSYGYAQLAEFRRLCMEAGRALDGRRLLLHAAASAPAMLLPESRLDMVRIGISLYGLWPSAQTRISMHGAPGGMIELRPVMRWVTRIVHMNELQAGSPVGYGCTCRTVAPTRLAVLPVGYFEGYERALSNRSHVLIRGRRAPLLGRVCMNMIMVDVTHIPGAAVGDEALLIGQDGDERISADDLAELTGTINYEVVTRIQRDLTRLVVE